MKLGDYSKRKENGDNLPKEDRKNKRLQISSKPSSKKVSLLFILIIYTVFIL